MRNSIFGRSKALMLFGVVFLWGSVVYGQVSGGQLSVKSEDSSDFGRYSKEIKESIAKGESYLESARESSSVMQMDCINEKLLSMKGFLNVAESGEANLADARARGDENAVRHHVRLVQLAVNRSRDLSEGIYNCQNLDGSEYVGPTTLDSKRECSVKPCLSDESLSVPDEERIGQRFVDVSVYM